VVRELPVVVGVGHPRRPRAVYEEHHQEWCQEKLHLAPDDRLVIRCEEIGKTDAKAAEALIALVAVRVAF
jgi:hypothetical protein